MEKIVEKEKQQLKVAIVAILILLCCQFINSCNVSSKVKSLTRTMASQDSTIQALLKKPEHAPALTAAEIKAIIEKSNEETMYMFLIYEDEFDKGKITLSQIKERIEAKK